MSKSSSNVTVSACKSCSHKNVCKYKDKLKEEIKIYKKELSDTKDSKLTTVKVECRYFKSDSFGCFGGRDDDDEDDLFS